MVFSVPSLARRQLDRSAQKREIEPKSNFRLIFSFLKFSLNSRKEGPFTQYWSRNHHEQWTAWKGVNVEILMRYVAHYLPLGSYFWYIVIVLFIFLLYSALTEDIFCSFHSLSYYRCNSVYIPWGLHDKL